MSATDLDDVLAEIAAGAAERESTGTPPFASFAALRGVGIGAIRVPARLGGGGVSLADFFAVVRRLGAADPNVAQALRNHFAFTEGLNRRPADPVRDAWLKRVVAGEIVGSAASEAGSAPAGTVGSATRLRATPRGLRLSGEKIYSTGNLYADLLVVLATDDDDALVTVIVPADRDGVVHVDDWDGMGQRFTASGTTRFDDVVVEASEVNPLASSPDPGTGLQATFTQLYLTTVVAGIMAAVHDDAVALVTSRERNFYHGLADHPRDEPSLHELVGELSALRFGAEAVVTTAAQTLDTAFASLGGPDADERRHDAVMAAAKAKVVVDPWGTHAATLLFEAGGASATRSATQLDRHWRNIRTLASHNPRSYKLRLIGAYDLNATPLPVGPFF